MKQFAALLLAMAAASPEIQYFQFQRPVVRAQQPGAQTCLVLDPEIFAHAAPQAADLRLYRDATETPYIIRTAAPVQAAENSIAPLNLGSRGGHTVFDAALPEGSYSDIEINVAAQDFIATVTVSGGNAQSDGGQTRLGSYTILDLTGQKLGRSTVLHLPQSNFHFLHFEIAGPLPPKSIAGLSVLRLPASQPKYVTVAASTHARLSGHSTIFEFTVPAHLPVDRIAFIPGAQPAVFSRDVAITITPQRPQTAVGQESPSLIAYSGNLLRIHSTESGHRIDEERLAIDTPGAQFDLPAQWTVTIHNGDDASLPIDSVRLQMLERDLCFEAADTVGYTLYYGDPALAAPHYDYETLFVPQTNAARAALGNEQRNPAYRARPDQRPFTEKHPILLWAALLVVIVLLAAIALGSAKATPRMPS
jgi:hypothetical protein